MKILIDHRERPIIELVRNISAQTEIVSLPLADILVAMEGRAFALERKTVSDFISSIRTNRLWEQLLRLMKAETILGYQIVRRMLVIHGDYNQYISGLDERGTTNFWASMMGAYMEILFVYDTPLIIAQDDRAFASFIRILLKRETRGANDKLPSPRWYRRHASTELPLKDRKRYVIDSIPLVGETHARQLLEHFGTIENVARASPEELQNVPGIGERKAKLIYEIFH